ncbi:MAG: TonB-dependent siderophore receptor, partial [Bacteroidia bacterium]
TLSDMGMTTKGEIYRMSSGVTKSYGGSLDMTVQIRGTDATYGTYRNGIGGPIWWNAQEDASMIERLEFVKGPSGFMLANSEPGGLINTVTKQPTHLHVAEIGFGVGSWNMMRTTIDLGGEFKKEGKLTYRLNIGYQQNNEYYAFGKFTRYFIAPALKYEFSNNTSITFENNYVKATAQENTHSSISINNNLWALPINMAINDPNQKPFYGADLYNRIFFQHKFNERWSLNAQGAFMTTDWDGTVLYIQGINATKDTINRANSYNDWWGKLSNLQLFLDGKFYTGKKMEHKILIGIDYGSGSEGSTFGETWGENNYNLAVVNPSYYLPKASLNYTGELSSWLTSNRWQALYVQDHLKVAEKIIFTVAGRYTHLVSGQDWNAPPDDPEYESTNSRFTPRLGLTYLMSKNFSLYVLHDESFLPQRGAIFNGGRLSPLTGSNNEFGLKALLCDKQLSITASVYDIQKNRVGIVDQLHDGYFIEAGQIRSTGFDFDIAGKLSENLFINANYSFVDARITKHSDESLIGLQNAGTARNLANVWAKYQLGNGKLSGIGFGAGMQFTDKRSGVWSGWNSNEGNKYLPAYTLFDVAISYATEKFNVGVNVYNILNKKYASNGWWYPEFQEWIFDVGAPMNFRLQTVYKF